MAPATTGGRWAERGTRSSTRRRKHEQAETNHRPPAKLPVWSQSSRSSPGPRTAEIADQLIVAMPAATGPDRNSVGMDHSGGLAALMP